MSNPSQHNFGFDQNADHNTILQMLRHQYLLPVGRKLSSPYVLVLSKGDTKHIVALPNFGVNDISIDFYIQLKKFSLVEDKLKCTTVVSGLSLMVGEYGGITHAIHKYNSISKDIGDYKLFGRIESMIDLSINCSITY